MSDETEVYLVYQYLILKYKCRQVEKKDGQKILIFCRESYLFVDFIINITFCAH